MELSLSGCLRAFPTSGVLNLTIIDIGGELSDVGYQSSFSKRAPQVGEILSCVFWGWIFSGLYISGERGDKKQYTEVSLLDGTAFL